MYSGKINCIPCEYALSPKERQKINSGYIYFILIQPGVGFSFMCLGRLLRGEALCELVDLNTFRKALGKHLSCLCKNPIH